MTRDDIAKLRQEHPGWFFTSTWVAAATGPDRRVLLATRGGVVVAGLTPADLAEKIRREDA